MKSLGSTKIQHFKVISLLLMACATCIAGSNFLQWVDSFFSLWLNPKSKQSLIVSKKKNNLQHFKVISLLLMACATCIAGSNFLQWVDSFFSLWLNPKSKQSLIVSKKKNNLTFTQLCVELIWFEHRLESQLLLWLLSFTRFFRHCRVQVFLNAS